MGFKQSILSVIGLQSSDDSGKKEDASAGKIRDAMLRTLDLHCKDAPVALELKIEKAKTVETLWYLRPELMLAVSENRGETVAAEVMVGISRMFKGSFKTSRGTLHIRR